MKYFNIITSDIVPEDETLLVGTICEHCHKPFDLFTICNRSLNKKHRPQAVKLQNIGKSTFIQERGYRLITENRN